MVNIERLTNEALDLITRLDWEKCVRYAEALQDEDDKKGILRDRVLEPIIMMINPNGIGCSYDEDYFKSLEYIDVLLFLLCIIYW